MSQFRISMCHETKRLLQLILMLLLVILLLHLLFMYHMYFQQISSSTNIFKGNGGYPPFHRSSALGRNKNTVQDDGQNSKSILLWTKIYHKDYDNIFTKGQNVINVECNRPCRFSRDRTRPEDHDALVFYTANNQSPPSKRRPSQIYVAFTLEAPGYMDKTVKGNFYNWSLAPPIHATVQTTYFSVKRKSKHSHEDYQLRGSSITSNKTKKNQLSSTPILWITSHCTSVGRRHLYVEKLKEYIPIDIYGKCGKRCVGTGRGEDCMKDLISTRNYKFYLSFENIACEDYITEKLYRPLAFGLVPIVFGGKSSKDYSREGVLPPNSYIDVRNFTSPKHLANYLKILVQNHGMYLSYHAWRSRFKVVQNHPWICQLCDASVIPNLLTDYWERLYEKDGYHRTSCFQFE